MNNDDLKDLDQFIKGHFLHSSTYVKFYEVVFKGHSLHSSTYVAVIVPLMSYYVSGMVEGELVIVPNSTFVGPSMNKCFFAFCSNYQPLLWSQ